MNAGYFAIITADVRYDERLSPNEKLLFGEIEALTQRDGYAWASNAYFAGLYGVSKYTISRWISKLQSLGYITAEIDRATGNKRKIFVNRNVQPPSCEKPQEVLTETAIGIDEKRNTPIAEKRNHNNTSMNNKKEYMSPALGEFENVCLTTDEKSRLVQRLGKDKAESYIERLSGWLAEGHTKKNHYATILNWWRKDGGRDAQQDAPPEKAPEIVTVPVRERTADEIRNLSVEELLL